MKQVIVGAVIALFAMAGTAHADEFPSSMRRQNCVGEGDNRFYPTDLYVAALATRFSVGYMAASQASQLGTVASRDAAGNCGSDAACQARARMYRYVRDMLRNPPQLNSPRGNTRFSIRVDQHAPGNDAAAILDNQAPWFHVVCHGQDDPPPSPPGYLARAVIGESVEDATREFSNRKFANIAFTDDQHSDTQSYTVNAAVVFPRIGSNPERRADGLPIQPFIALQRNFSETNDVTKRDVDDLTFGLTATLFERVMDAPDGNTPADVHRVTAALEWETDTEFESSVSSVRLTYEPQLGRIPCLGHNWSEQFPLRCEFRAVADWLEVGDPGEKVALATSPDFTRLGFDVGFNYDLTPPDFPGQVTFTLDYQRRDDLDSTVGDADLFRTGLTLQPGKASHFSFGIEFATGEDLSSLQEQRQLVLRLGYRR